MRNLSIFRVSVVAFIAFLSLGARSQAITAPRTPSPAAEVSQTIGISKVTVNYSRPSVKGREVWGQLVPYGWNVQGFGSGNSAPWRAGANENTTIAFSHDAKVEGQVVPAGTYGLFYVINKDNTGEVILSRDNRSWGSFFYDPKQDQLKATINLKTIPPTELLTYDFTNFTKNSADLVLNWEKKQFPVKIEFDVNKIVMANAEQELKGPTGFTWQGFASAAAYSLQNKINLEQGLKWINLAIAQNSNFNTLNVKSGILKEMGKTAEAEKIINDALAISTNAELNAYAYQLMNDGDNTKAIEMFILNTKRFPKDPNTFDSLGEGYFNSGDKKNAIVSFKKSLSLNPPANVKANSEKFLRQMGAL
ncbi:MAG TPA: DUF2911 domain-containing protein [Ferruginibacter sp.]|nr:DUF2911 domain-containing protein [Ferruginibacter sp.]